MTQTIFDQPQSLALNERRLIHLSGLKLDNHMHNTRVLEVGAGVGLLTHFFGRLAREIVSTDGREKNVLEHKKRHPDRLVYTVDLLQPQSHHHLGRFDTIFCYGVLYHLGKPAEVIKDLADICDGMLFIETMVAAAAGLPNDGSANIGPEKWGGGMDQSLDNMACYPSVAWVVEQLKQHFGHVYVPHFTYDREVFVGSKFPVEELDDFIV